ncbi:PREDICTED: receptor like protein 30 [Camelina sativa]|uniref:Receptor like protein 30 n=1 Tax=Camelina sativa TaxID=90675 RepID=A0ABM0Z8V2_CAMSA|nr:PREDICTED: receptor like protein 30 [Camelina sativa]
MIRSQSDRFLGIIITIYFLFFLISLPNTLASPTRSLCRSDQRDALLELKKEFTIHSNDNGHVTTVLWNKSADCCSWEGVTCDATLGEVISLNLISETANTSLKPSSGLFKLQHLRELDLSFCHLQGDIPSSIGNLSHLKHLDLSCNQLVGEFPASVGNLNQLEYLDLSVNNLRGNIPTSFANLTKLSELHLRENQFTSGIRVLANLTTLSIIDLSFNHFKSSISSDLSGLHNLERLWVYNNSFFGPFPSFVLTIPSLVDIALSENQFEGAIDFGNTSSSSKLTNFDVSYNNFDGLIPESISKFVNLKNLDLSHNNFGGPVPSSISKLVNLDHLYLNHNNLGGKVPRSIFKLVNIEYLDLSHNNFGGPVPRSISRLVNLSSLDLSYNKLNGEVPHCIWSSSKLNSVDVSYNSFTSFGKSVELGDGSLERDWDLSSNSLQGPIPKWICNFKYFSFLDFSNNHLNGSIPQCLKNSTDYGMLNLRNNSLSGFMPDLCMDGSQLRSLDVSLNNFVGKLPKSLINCEVMEFLNVRGNKIKDTFPFWLGSLQHLTVLVLRSNTLYGPLYNPSAYLGFPSMRIMDISNNNFSGSLPQDYFANWTEMSSVWSRPIRTLDYKRNIRIPGSNYMGDRKNNHKDSIELVYKGVDMDFVQIFKAFKAIDFSGNRFSGHIPGSIGLLSELRLLNLSGNAFTGNIPPSLANITKLETLDLSRNNFSGEIPRGLGKLSFLSTINFSHNHLQGLVPRSTQFRSQNCSSFTGNPGLYGLEEICGEKHVSVPTPRQQDESTSESEEPMLSWIAAAIAFGPGVFYGLVSGHIFTSYKHRWFMAG